MVLMKKDLITPAGIVIERCQQPLHYPHGIQALIEQLDTHRGAVFISNVEYPGRYTAWDIGFCNPPLSVKCQEKAIVLEALNDRGKNLLLFLKNDFEHIPPLQVIASTDTQCIFAVSASQAVFTEEERSQQPSSFTLLRHLLARLKVEDDAHLGFYGAFGYDLIFQFEDITLKKARDPHQRDMVLYFPDEIVVVDHRKEDAWLLQYEFKVGSHTTAGLRREGEILPYTVSKKDFSECDHLPGEYMQVVEKAKEKFACGDLFEVVPSQTFSQFSDELPSTIFKRLCQKNPSPYSFFINLGEKEYLIGASPEMYVRVQGSCIETCPISGTIKRGNNAIEDAINIQRLLDSPKEESELTMCTDVDRNDKSRICKPGSVEVIGRRQIEMYSRLIHTVDHVIGELREGFDAVDAFLTHMWVVTVTGAPKLWAMQFIEYYEKTPRKWYAGAVGWFNLNGDLNTGLVLRTIQLKQGHAEVRAGATLLYDSIPQEEEQETRLKAAALMDVLRKAPEIKQVEPALPQRGRGKKVLLIDHQDSFVHTLGNYVRQTGAAVTTIRYTHALTYLQQQDYDLIILSPGPGRPVDFHLKATIDSIVQKNIPLFGVCLGLQGIVEYFEGELGVLDYPMHGKPSTIKVLKKSGLFAGFEERFVAGRYHSLFAKRDCLPATLEVTAETEDQIVMAIAHRERPIYAVQFHPETILSLAGEAGLRIINNLMGLVCEKRT